MFQIRFTKRVVFRDCKGTELKIYEPGDIINATAFTSTYYVTPMGGIYKDEAETI